MTYIQNLIAINLLIWIPWLWRYRMKPFIEKNRLSLHLKNHPDWNNIYKTERLLVSLFKNVKSKRISRSECKRLHIDHRDYVYGEIEFLSFYSILDKVKPQPNEIFYDLGCGGGKAIFASALYFDLSSSRGIEVLPGLCAKTNEQIQKAQRCVELNKTVYSPIYQQRLSRIQVINKNFLDYDFSDGDIIFINATALCDNTWKAVFEKLLYLKQGCRVITTTKKIQHDNFEIIYQGKELMSWGMNSVNIYRIR